MSETKENLIMMSIFFSLIALGAVVAVFLLSIRHKPVEEKCPTLQELTQGEPKYLIFPTN